MSLMLVPSASDMPQCGIGDAGSRRRGELERLERFFVVEAVEQRQAFVEELLRVGVRGLDGAVIRAEIAEQRGARGAPARGAVCIECAD